MLYLWGVGTVRNRSIGILLIVPNISVVFIVDKQNLDVLDIYIYITKVIHFDADV